MPFVSRPLRALFAFTLSLAFAAGVAAQARPKLTDVGMDRPASSILIGNSFFYYNNSLHDHLRRLVSAGMGGFSHRSTSITISGSGFDWHDVDSYFRPKAVGGYSFTPDNKVVFNKLDKLFDVAIMMDCSQCPLHPQLAPVFTEYAKKHADTVRKHGAKPAFFMSWAYKDDPSMTQPLADAYTRAGNDNDAFVIPAGLAFARSVAARPELELYAPDKRHPSLAGTYLAAAVTYAAVFRQNPVGNSYTAGLDAATARHLQQVAADTVRAYYAQP